MAYASAYQRMPGMGVPGMGGMSPGQPSFVPQMPGGFSPPSVGGPVGMGGGGGGMPGQGGGGMFGFLDELGPLEKAYLLSQGIGGIASGVQGWMDRREDKRRYDEQTALDRQHRRSMGSSWQAAYG